jgi:predicted GNAT family acetyltransferase
MWLDLDDDVAPTARDLDRLARRGITCRLATEEDLPGLRRAAAAVLGTTGVLGGVWGDELTAGVRGARSGVYVATLDGEIRAFAGFSIYRSTMFGPTGTEGDLRGSGIGEVLLRLALDAIRARGATHAEIGWVADGALPFYSRTVGATCGAAFWILTKPLTG